MATPPVFSAGAVLTAAQMNAVGMWKISSQTFSAASAVTFDNVFTSDYRHYRIVVDAIHSSTWTTVWYRLRSGGADNTASNYWYRTAYFNAAWAFDNASATDKALFMLTTTAYNGVAQDIFLPQIAQRTSFSGTQYDHNDPTTRIIGSGYSTTTQFDGIKLYPNAGTITGTATIYGYND